MLTERKTPLGYGVALVAGSELAVPTDEACCDDFLRAWARGRGSALTLIWWM